MGAAPSRKEDGDLRRYRRAIGGASMGAPTRRAPGDGMHDPHTEARVREAASRAGGAELSAAPVKRLAGHASMRSYWRVGAPPRSVVVMVMPLDARPEEVTKGGPPPVNPFVDVQRYLAAIGVRVPAIRAFYEAEGLMVLEDLGDEMLETRLLAGQPAEALYPAAVDALARLRAAAERR